MDDTFVTTVCVILADMERALQLPIKYKPKMTPAEILTVAVVAAKYFHNHPEVGVSIAATAPPKATYPEPWRRRCRLDRHSTTS